LISRGEQIYRENWLKLNLCWFDEAVSNQRLDPACSVTLNREFFVVSGAVPVMFAPFEHEENGTQYFMTQCHD